MKKCFALFVSLIASSFFFSAFAQHDMHNMQMKKDTTPHKQMPNMSNMKMHHDSTSQKMGNMKMNHDTMPMKTDHMQHMGMMSHSFSRNLSMSRNGSGTSWLPDASPVYGHMIMYDKSMLMLHGNIFLRYTNQDIFNKEIGRASCR